MEEYTTEWKDYQLPTGQKFAIGICGYNKMVRYFSYGADPLKKIFGQTTYIENGECNKSKTCLAKDCPLNNATDAELAHILEIDENDTVDETTAKQWGSNTLVGCYVQMAKSMTNELNNSNK